MGQKIIPISLRLNKKENWHSNWVVDKKEYSNLLHFDLEIRKYFENIFNTKDTKLIKLNIIKSSNNIYIYIYVKSSKIYKLSFEDRNFLNKIIFNLNSFYKEHNIKILLKNMMLNDVLPFDIWIKKFLRFYSKTKQKKNKVMQQMVYYLSFALLTNNFNIISFIIKKMLEKKKNHKKYIKDINDFLQLFYNFSSTCLGYRLQLKGRLNGSKRKKKAVYQKGKIPLNTLEHNIQYYFNEFKTPSGICSIKLWIFLEKNN